MAQTTDEIIALARARAFWPDGDDGPLTNVELLALLTAEHRNVVFPTITKLRTDYGVFPADYPMSAGVEFYRMPPRAHGSRVVGLEITDGSGRIWKPRCIRRVEIAGGNRGDWDIVQTTGEPGAVRYYLLGNRIGFHPIPAFAANLRVYYPLNPPVYVPEADARKIVAYNGATIITAATPFPAGWGPVDIIAAQGPGEPLAINRQAASIVGPTLTLAATPPLVWGVNDIAPGDWVSNAGQSAVVSLPESAFSALCDLLVARMHESQGDAAAYATSAARAVDGLRQTFELLGDRTDDEADTYLPESAAMWNG